MRNFLVRRQIDGDAIENDPFSSGEGAREPTRFNFIMSSKVKGRLPVESLGGAAGDEDMLSTLPRRKTRSVFI
ncbi:hypothetical protein BH20VER3_BH20VER3_07520 [soil metagenome]